MDSSSTGSPKPRPLDPAADPLRLQELRAAPTGGPRVLFFSGGSALRPLSRQLKLLSHNSAHLITPFDSGGSSAALRAAFAMPSVGDLRNRMLALADETQPGSPAIYRLFTHRLGAKDPVPALQAEVRSLAEGSHPLIRDLPEPLHAASLSFCQRFIAAKPKDFDLRGASIGNLLLTGAWLQESQDLAGAVTELSQLLQVLGEVHPVTIGDQHLAAELADGSEVLGQHRITGKECPALQRRIKDLHLIRGLDDPRPAASQAAAGALRAIAEADHICFPMGSFWTSVVANLLPRGIGQAIAASSARKTYIPNAGHDPEEYGLPIHEALEVLRRKASLDAGENLALRQVVDTLLLDSDAQTYGSRLDPAAVDALGLRVIRTRLRDPEGSPRLDPVALAEILACM